MSPRIDAPALQLLSEVIALLDTNERENTDTWSGKRDSRRTSVLLPLRLRPLDAEGKPYGPAFTARSRDICERGVGLTIPCVLPLQDKYQVEMFTDIGTWVGRMQAVHCTQTVGGYKVGMESLDTPRPERPTTPAQSVTEPVTPESEPLTVDEARVEIHEALRNYYRAKYSWGLLGVSLETQIQRVMNTLPPADDADIRTDPRRACCRQEVQGEIYVLVLAQGGPELLTAQIADISCGGARVIVPSSAELPVEMASGEDATASAVIVGLWTKDSGTVWVPARLVHRQDLASSGVSLGLEFMQEAPCRQLI